MGKRRKGRRNLGGCARRNERQATSECLGEGERSMSLYNRGQKI